MALDDEDPFSVVKPQSNNVKMSQYIRKHKQRREIEECSHGTNSTRSTTISNRTEDHLHQSHKSTNSTISGMFSTTSSDGSFANFGEEDENCDGDAPAIAFGSDFGNGLEFGANGNDTPSGSRTRKSRGSRKECSSSSSSSRKPKSEKILSTSHHDTHDDFFSGDPFANNFGVENAPINFGDGDFGENLFADDPFGEFAGEDDDKRGSFQQTSRSSSHSENRRRDRIPRRYHSSDGIDLSGASTAKSPGKPQSRRRMTVEESVEVERKGQPVRARSGISRRSSLDLSGHIRPSSRPDDEQSLFSTQTEPADLKKPFSRRTRRSSLGMTHSDDSLPGFSNRSLTSLPPPAPGGTPRQRGIPLRQKNSAGTAIDPRVGGERKMLRSRRLNKDGSSSTLTDLFSGSSHSTSLSVDDDSEANDSSNGNKWTTDRSRNQEMIMSMYKDGATSKKSEHQDRGSSSDLGRDMDALGINEEDLLSSALGSSAGVSEKKRRSALSKLKEMTKKKNLEASPGEDEDIGGPDARTMAGRSRGSLLERVGAIDEPLDRPSAARKKGGSSYSDRILMNSSRG